MRKRELSDSEFAKVRKLKETGANWSKIQRETGVPRRIAKRTYDEWEHRQSLPDLREARKIVAADALREHIESLLQIAEYLTSSLDIPQTPSNHKTADEFLQELWQIDILQKSESYTTRGVLCKEHKRELITSTNEILFRALQDHTQKTKIWNTLQQWKDAWNDCVSSSSNLKESVTTIVENNLNQERGLLDKLRQAHRKYNSVDRLSDAITWTLWKQAVDVNPTAADEIALVLSRNNRYEVAFVRPMFPSKFSNGVICSFEDKSLAENAAKACNQSYTSFTKGVEAETVMKPMKSRVSQSRDVIDTLGQMLHPLLLKPIIIRSACDLCPA